MIQNVLIVFDCPENVSNDFKTFRFQFGEASISTPSNKTFPRIFRVNASNFSQIRQVQVIKLAL